MGKISKESLLGVLKNDISCEEWQQIENNPDGISLSTYNRQILLELKGCKIAKAQSNLVEMDKIRGLVRYLISYLDKYMNDRPEGHKWIIICCIFLTFILEKPMHPQSVVNYTTESNSMGIHYYCPYRSEDIGSTCLFCAAEKP